MREGVLHARGSGGRDMESRERADVRAYTTWGGADGPEISGARDAFRFPVVAWGTSKACMNNAWTRALVTQTADVACRNRQPGRQMGRPHSGLMQDHGVVDAPKSLGVQRMHLSHMLPRANLPTGRRMKCSSVQIRPRAFRS